MGWGSKRSWSANNNEPPQPTGYWFCWQEGIKGPRPQYKAKTESAARKQYKKQFGVEPDYCEEEME